MNSGFGRYITKKLSGLTANNIQKSGSLAFGSLTHSNISNYLSVFGQSGADISAIDYGEIVKALKEGSLDGIESDETKGLTAVLNELLGMEGISEEADISGDGEIDASELEKLVKVFASADDDGTKLTLADIDVVFKYMGVDLDSAAEKAVLDALAESVQEVSADEAAKIENTQANEIMPSQQIQQQMPVNRANASSSPRAASAGMTTPSVQNAAKAETAEEIQKQIDEKNEEISNVESDAEDKIQAEEDAKEQAMKQTGVQEKEYEAYKEKEQELENNIKNKESQISGKEDEINDYNSTISSNESYISDLDSQISDNKAKLSQISDDDENGAAKKSDINAKISNLESEKSKKEQENQALKEKVTAAENEKAKLETEKEKLETQKQELLSDTLNQSKGFAKGVGSSAVVNELKAQITQYDENIAQIRNEKNSKISEIKSEIQALEVKLKDVQAKDERELFLNDNKASIGLGLTGEELVDVAKQMLDRYGSSRGWCATGVSRTFAMAYGLDLHGNGCDWTANMDDLVSQGAFEEVTGDYATSADLVNLPAGAVVTWDSTGGTSGGAKYGHVTIADGNGGEISDHYAPRIYQSIGGRKDTYHVYIPV